MRKSILFIVIVFAVLTALGCMQVVHALDLDLINSVRQNEIISAENLTIDINTTNATTAANNTITTTDSTDLSDLTSLANTTNPSLDTTYYNTLDTTYNSTEDAFPYNSTYYTTDTVPATSQTTTINPSYTTTSNSLSIGNILSILLIVVGFLLILLGVAIIIRMKK